MWNVDTTRTVLKQNLINHSIKLNKLLFDKVFLSLKYDTFEISQATLGIQKNVRLFTSLQPIETPFQPASFYYLNPSYSRLYKIHHTQIKVRMFVFQQRARCPKLAIPDIWVQSSLGARTFGRKICPHPRFLSTFC